MAVRQILGAVGAVIGAYVGGPAGARWGWAIGSAIGNVVDPVIIKGPTIGDLATQTSQEGVPRTIAFGLSPPMAGNIIASGPPRVVKRKKSQGKGGPKVETETVYRTYAIGVGEGPIFGFVRIWRNGEVVYDAGDPEKYQSPTVQDILVKALRLQANNQKFTEKATFYLGDYTQTADPALEALFGVGTTPAHRGTAYVVIEDDDLTDLRGAIPQYLFQVVTVGSLDCDDTVEYANEYLGGWAAASTNLQDPRGVCADYKYSAGTFNGKPIRDTLEEAIADKGAPTLVSQLLGWNMRNDAPEGIYPYNSTMPTDDYNYVRNLFFNQTQPSALVDATWASGLFTTFATANQLHGKWWTGRRPSSNLTHGTWRQTGPTGWQEDADRGIQVFLLPGEPPNPCAPCLGGNLVPSEIPGYCKDTDGNYYADTPWSLDARTYKVLQLTHLATDDNVYDKRPLGPARPIGHADYNSQPFWETAYNAAVVLGTMPAGLTYNTHYPKTQAFGYTRVASLCTLTNLGVPLPTLVAQLCERVGMTQYDVSQLTGTVQGFAITNAYPCTEALRALGQVFFFDAAPYDGVVHFIPRGKNTVATITEAEMVEDDSDIEQSKRADPIDIPRVLNLNYFDVAGGLATDKQTSERSGDRRSMGEAQLQTPVVFSANEAARVVRINHKVMIEDQRAEKKFSLPDSFIGLVPSDCIFLQVDGRTDRLRLVKCEIQDGFQEYIALFDRQSAYTSNIEGIPAAAPSLPASNVIGPTLLEIMDIHILRDVDDNVGLLFYVAASGISEAWRGAVIELSYDGGANYVDSETTDVSALMGELMTELPDHPQAYPDETHTVRVVVNTPAAEFTETDLVGLYNGANRALIGDEIVQFANAVEVEEGVWDLSLMLRGRKGTFPTTHPVGTRFVFLDVYTPIAASITDLGRTLTFRATSLGEATDTGTVKSIVYTGLSQTERAPEYLAAHRDGTDAVVTWQGVGRLGAGVTVAHGARFAGYRVTFNDDVLPSVVVDTAAQTLTQDVSALGAPLTITVQQLNELTGAGPAAEVTVA